MAKPLPKKPTPEIEEQVVVMRRVAPGRFEVVSGVVRGELEVTKTLESNVTLMVGRQTARKHLDEQHRKRSAALGLEGGN